MSIWSLLSPFFQFLNAIADTASVGMTRYFVDQIVRTTNRGSRVSYGTFFLTSSLRAFALFWLLGAILLLL